MEIIINENTQLDEVLEVAKKVFNPTPDEMKQYHRKELWLEKLNNEGVLLTANENNEVVGFAVCYKKEKSFHIWNVGVLNNYRKKGIWKNLYSEIVKYAKQKGHRKLTINTFKNKFPSMYNFLVSNGFHEISVDNEKSYFEKTL